MRYWGTPLPIWKCNKCDNKIVIGSVKELEKLSGKKVKNVHKPEIDEITIKCKCKEEMKRVPEVLDVWFDSGVSSWAALNDEEFKKFWPADLNIEGKDQIRGWWNSQLILSEIKFGKKPFESVSVHGMILDLGKRKMSKSLGNIISPKEIIEKFGRDYMRYYFTKLSKGEDFAFDEKEFLEIGNFFRVFININNFVNQLENKKGKIMIEDKWVLSRFNLLIDKITKYYNEYKFPEAVAELERFLNELSKTYIQMIRERSDEVYDVMNKIRIGLLKLLAPICPFVTEKIWLELKEKKIVKEESVHLSDFSKVDKNKINKNLEADFTNLIWIIENGLRERDKAQIGLKWPLAMAEIYWCKKFDKDLEQIIMRQLNIKKIKWNKSLKESEWRVVLDTKITEELEAEGYAREISRAIQNERKKAGLVKTDLIKLEIAVGDLKNTLKKHEKFIKERVNAKNIFITTIEKKRFKYLREFKIKEKRIVITFGKV